MLAAGLGFCAGGLSPDLSLARTCLVFVGKFGVAGAFAACYLYLVEQFPTREE